MVEFSNYEGTKIYSINLTDYDKYTHIGYDVGLACMLGEPINKFTEKELLSMILSYDLNYAKIKGKTLMYRIREWLSWL